MAVVVFFFIKNATQITTLKNHQHGFKSWTFHYVYFTICILLYIFINITSVPHHAHFSACGETWQGKYRIAAWQRLPARTQLIFIFILWIRFFVYSHIIYAFVFSNWPKVDKLTGKSPAASSGQSIPIFKKVAFIEIVVLSVSFCL